MTTPHSRSRRRRDRVLDNVRGRLPRPLTALALLVGWALVAVPVAAFTFTHSSTSTEIASHDAVVRPALDGYATVDFGPYLPNLRYPTGERVGAEIRLGETQLRSYDALLRRYGFIGSRPEGEIAKLRRALTDLAWSSAATGAVAGLVVPGLWLLLGPRRRAELAARLRSPRGGTAALALVVAGVAVLQPWRLSTDDSPEVEWRPVTEELPQVPVPDVARPLEVQAGLMTSGTKRLAESAFDTYARSLAFYDKVLEATVGLSGQLRQPAEDETVAVLVSDRHDNIGMDPVARAIADQGGATVLLDAGDDTSTGSDWEAFSLDSLSKAFDDYEHRYFVAGNHDHGGFVTEYLTERGLTNLDGEVVKGPDGIRLLGVNDPRSSGLGTWREETGLSFSEQADRLADLACAEEAEGDRVSTVLVHDANTGRRALERGCVDLVLAGHLHAQRGPTQVVGENGEAGYTFTTGTTGGAAYALAIGSKLRRDAQVTLITYRDGRPVGIQPVTVRTPGDIVVGDFVELSYPGPSEVQGEVPGESEERLGPPEESSEGPNGSGGGGGI